MLTLKFKDLVNAECVFMELLMQSLESTREVLELPKAIAESNSTF